jgi:hypothetical protein
MRRLPALLVALALLACLPAATAARPAAGGARTVDPAIAYWTAERIRHAVPRDFVRTPDGGFTPAAKPGGGGGGGGSKSVTGASWTGGGPIVKQSGRVLFHLAGGDWICSASVVDDGGDASYSVILTAGHCAYDEATHQFATNWVYYPSFDTSPTYDCANATYGCWAAQALFVHTGFASESGFTATATLYDFAFAVVGTGGNPGVNPQLDALGSYAINTSLTRAPSGGGYAFGYPAAGKYSPGIDLTYCKGSISTDPYNLGRTWKIGCDMTGGSSGGPWLYGTSNPGSPSSEGTLFSLNSYTYSGVRAMHGPKFNANTNAVLQAALAATPAADGAIDTTVVH